MPKQLDAGPFEAEVGLFWLHLAAEGKAGSTPHTYAEAVRWFAAAHLLHVTRFRHHFSHTWLDRGGAGGSLGKTDLPLRER